MSDVDEECEIVRRLLRDNGELHTLCLDAFSEVCEIHESLNEPIQLKKAVNSICGKILTCSFQLDEEDSKELFIPGMNFALFISTTRDYFAAVIRSVDASDTEEFCPPRYTFTS